MRIGGVSCVRFRGLRVYRTRSSRGGASPRKVCVAKASNGVAFQKYGMCSVGGSYPLISTGNS